MRIATTFTALFAALALAACGGDKVSSSEYLSKCKDEAGNRFKEQTALKITDKQVADFCQCTQDELVDQGLGDKDINDEELSRDKGVAVGRTCATKVFTTG